MQPQDRPRPVDARSACVFWLAGALVLSLVWAAWQAVSALLLAFAAAIFATMLSAVSRPLTDYMAVPPAIALPIAAIILLALPVVGFVLIGPELRGQLEAIAQAVPAALQSLERALNVDFAEILKDATGTDAAGGGNGSRGLISDAISVGRALLSNLGTAGGLLLSTLAGLVVVVVGGFFLAADPDRYRRGVVRLVPMDHQDKIDHAIGNCGRVLDRWLRAQLAAMFAVGLLAGLGAWLIGLPAPLAIGVISGVLEFFPIIGPWLGAVPVLLLAVGQGMQVVIAAGVMLLVIQQLEANVITPLAQDTMVEIPPFLVLFGLIAFGLVFGLIGIVVAGPLTLIAYVLINELYIKDALGQDIQVPGEADPAEVNATKDVRAP